MYFVKEREPRPGPGPVAKVPGKSISPSGTISWWWDGSENARAYYFRWSTTPEDPNSFVTSKAIFGKTYVTSDHVPGSLVYGQVQGINGKNEGDWSDLAILRVA